MTLLAQFFRAALVAAILAPTPLLADELNFERREFKSTWRQKGSGNRIAFDKSKRSFAVEFGGKYLQFNTSDATYSHCTSGRDGGANLCVSGRLFDCAFLVTISASGGEVNLDLRRAGGGDDFCRGMSGDYIILAN